MEHADPRPALSPDRARHRWAVAGLLFLLGAASVWAFTEDTGPIRTESSERVDPDGVYNPVTAGEPLPDGFRQLLPRDAIRPIYDPVFVRARQTRWPDDTDVIGVARGGEAKAYPVSHLNGRELVVDEIDGWPILVSW
jgi:hypothetical protein